jgi:hypothetical protein
LASFIVRQEAEVGSELQVLLNLLVYKGQSAHHCIERSLNVGAELVRDIQVELPSKQTSIQQSEVSIYMFGNDFLNINE